MTELNSERIVTLATAVSLTSSSSTSAEALRTRHLNLHPQHSVRGAGQWTLLQTFALNSEVVAIGFGLHSQVDDGVTPS